MEKRKKILIDTDIGDDIDDAFALYLAMSLGLDIVGITTVFQDTAKRARLTKKLLKKYGRGYESVPVYAGHGVPIDSRREEIPMCQYTPDLESEEYLPDGAVADDAVDFIIECCKKYGDELTVLAIGPFTNIARALEKDPHIFEKVGHFVIMGGAYYKQYVDWNVYCDVPAAEMMFNGISNMECLGADVTHRIPLTVEQCKKISDYCADDAGAAEISALYSSWWACGIEGRTVLHDPLAVYYAYDPSICVTEKQSITVIGEGFGRGLTLNVDAFAKTAGNPAYDNFDRDRKQIVAKDVDVNRMIYEFIRCFE